MNTKQKDPEKYYVTEEGNIKLKSTKDADEKREKRVDSVRLRLPQGMQDKIKAYVATLPEYRRMYGGEYVPNVNQWMIDTLKDALPEEYR